MFQAQNRETINSTWKVAVSFKIIMTTSVTINWCTVYHHQCMNCKLVVVMICVVCRKTKHICEESIGQQQQQQQAEVTDELNDDDAVDVRPATTGNVLIDDDRLCHLPPTPDLSTVLPVHSTPPPCDLMSPYTCTLPVTVDSLHTADCTTGNVHHDETTVLANTIVHSMIAIINIMKLC